VAYPLSTRHVEELMAERGVSVDHATINRWVIKYSPQLEEVFHRRKRSVWVSWRLDETYIKVKGHWYYLYRAVDKTGQTIAILLTEHRDEKAAKRLLTQAIHRHGVPAKITIEGSEANAAAIRSSNQDHGTTIVIRQVKYLNNIIERIGVPVRPGQAGRRAWEEAMPPGNFVYRPAGANPARLRGSPPEPGASLAPSPARGWAMRRQANVRAVGRRPRHLESFRRPSGLSFSEGHNHPCGRRRGEEGRVSGGGGDHSEGGQRQGLARGGARRRGVERASGRPERPSTPGGAAIGTSRWRRSTPRSIGAYEATATPSASTATPIV
jgi:transposase-like protein